MIVAAIMAVLTARYLGQQGEVLTFGAMGAIPAVVCSWLSEKIEVRKADIKGSQTA